MQKEPKVIFAAFGSSRLLFFDQVFGYIVNVTKDKQPTFTCAGVLAFTPFSNDGEIIDIKVNADLTKGINRRTTSSSDIMENKISVTLQTIGAIPNNQNILKVTWLSSTATKKRLINLRILLESYMLIVLSVIDVKYPQKEHRIDCKSVIHGSMKEEQFKGFGLSKVIDFGPCFVLLYQLYISSIIRKLFQPVPITSHLISSNLYTNEETFITAAPLSADIPEMKNDTNLSYEKSLILFSEIFKKLIDLASNNVALTHDVIKKSEAISTLDDKL